VGRKARSLEQIPEWTPIQLAWLAGFLDGEGHLAIQRTATERNGMRYYTPIVQVSQAGEAGIALIRQLQADLGGIGTLAEAKSRREGWRDSATLMLYGAMTKTVCSMVLPYLRLKRAQAQAIIDWPLRRTYSQGRLGTVMDAETAAKQEEIFQEVRKLNAFRMTKNAEP
jgi:hypothetical protein